MTWLDRAIGWVSPGTELRRARVRAALRVVRAYEGAALTRRTSGWKTSGASANSEIASAQARLRARSRDLVRNNPYARRAKAAWVGNAVGTGIQLAVDQDAVTKLFQQWSCEADFYADHDLNGQLALTAGAGFESGDCLIVRVRTSSAEAGASGVPLRLKVLEGDFLDINKHGPLANGNVAIAGVEVDPDGRRVAFWLYTVHPGETWIFSPKMQSVRIPAEDVIYHFEKERPGQLLGVPRLAAAIMRLRDLDEYQDAVIVKKKIEACFAAFVTSDADDVPVGTSTDTDTDPDGNARRIDRVSPGLINRLKPGEEVTFGQPTSGPEVGFVADQLRAIAAGAGVTYEQLTGDLSRVNYSSMRGGRAEFKILIEQYRWLTFMPQVCERIYRWFEEAAYMAGKIRTTGYKHTWTPPRWEYVNPKEDVETKCLELDSCLISHSEAARERGENFDDLVAAIKADRDKLAAAEIEPNYSIKGAAPAQDATSTTTDAGSSGSDSEK